MKTHTRCGGHRQKRQEPLNRGRTVRSCGQEVDVRIPDRAVAIPVDEGKGYGAGATRELG